MSNKNCKCMDWTKVDYICYKNNCNKKCDQKYKEKCNEKCRKCPTVVKKYNVVNLVSNVPNLAPTLDTNAINSWGILIDKNKLWVVDNGSGLITTYNTDGSITMPVVTVLAASGNPADTGTPTGIVRNNSLNFVISNFISQPATYLVCTEDGTVAGYNAAVNATNAITVINNSRAGAIYKGLAITQTNLYVCDFHNGKIDTFDTAFNLLVGFPFIDPTLPSGFAPFNIVLLNNKLYVLYAKQDTNAEFDVSGPGNGYVSIFNTSGMFIQRFISAGYLNSPWALIPAPLSQKFPTGSVLIGNFGNGTITAYDACGTFLGRLQDNNCVDIIIDGLWGLVVYNTCVNSIFFASGPNIETNGLIGAITPKC